METNPLSWIDDIKKALSSHTKKINRISENIVAIINLLDDTIFADYAKLRMRVSELETQVAKLQETKCQTDTKTS